MNRKVLLLIVPMVIFFSSAQAQAYQSLFGQNSTSWLIYWLNLGDASIDSFYVEKDTLVNGIAYKKVALRPRSFYEGGLIREDLDSGIVRYRDLNYSYSGGPEDTIERIIFRYDLEVGDTFDISNTYLGLYGHYPDSLNIVDKIEVKDGLKYIYFKGKFVDEPITIIEGIGPNKGILWKHNQNIMGGEYLLCSYKDGSKTGYQNIKYQGNCKPGLSVKDIPSKYDISFHPNPAYSNIVLENNTGKTLSKIQIIAVDGRLLKEIYNPSETVPLSDIPKCYCFIHFLSADFKIIKPLLIQ